jgi:hypothetical protein
MIVHHSTSSAVLLLTLRTHRQYLEKNYDHELLDGTTGRLIHAHELLNVDDSVDVWNYNNADTQTCTLQVSARYLTIASAHARVLYRSAHYSTTSSDTSIKTCKVTVTDSYTTQFNFADL